MHIQLHVHAHVHVNLYPHVYLNAHNNYIIIHTTYTVFTCILRTSNLTFVINVTEKHSMHNVYVDISLWYDLPQCDLPKPNFIAVEQRLRKRLQNLQQLLKSDLLDASEKHTLASTPAIFAPNQLSRRISPHRKVCPRWKTFDFPSLCRVVPSPDSLMNGNDAEIKFLLGTQDD